jgi:hypothetical protein
MQQQVAAIRALIKDGKTDAEIESLIGDSPLNRGAGQDFGSTEGAFKALSNTLHRAVDSQCPVSAHEMYAVLGYFRTVWEEVVANGDKPKVDAACESAFAAIAPNMPVAKAYQQLVDDAEVLMLPVDGLTESDRELRADVQKRYLLRVDNKHVICLAKASAAVIDALAAVFTILGADGRYQELSSNEAIANARCTVILVMPRPTWATLMREASATN